MSFLVAFQSLPPDVGSGIKEKLKTTRVSTHSGYIIKLLESFFIHNKVSIFLEYYITKKVAQDSW